jgi:hypothetical protein
MARPDAYLPLDLNLVGECELYILPGVSAASDAFTIAGLRITKLSYQEWNVIEKSTFISDMQSVYAYDRLPLFCVFSGTELDADDTAVMQRTRQRGEAVRRLVLALRLSREAQVLEPTEFIAYRRSQGLNVRDPRIYGREAYELTTTVEIADSDLPHLEGLYEALEVFAHFRRPSAVDVAIQLFSASYDQAAVEGRDRMLLLVAALEAMTDGKGGPLRSIRWQDAEITAFLRKYQRTRNALVHEGGVDDDVETHIVLMRRIVRSLICEGIRNELIHPGENRSSGLALLEGMRDLTDLGSRRLDPLKVGFDAWSS